MRKLLVGPMLLLSLAIAVVAQERTRSESSGCCFLKGELPTAPQPQTLSSANPIQAPGRARANPVSQPEIVLSLEGMRAHFSLLSEVSSKLPSGARFQARLEEPMVLNGQTLLPAGTLLEGYLETARARRPMRPGSVFMSFERLLLPDGIAAPVSMSLLAASSDSVKTDEEGQVHPALSKKRLLIQIGGSLLVGKLADDLAEVAGGTAVGAGTARFIGLGTAAAFLLIQKGREVRLRPGDRLEVEFGRPAEPSPLAQPTSTFVETTH
jgi:hypothetical protein